MHYLNMILEAELIIATALTGWASGSSLGQQGYIWCLAQAQKVKWDAECVAQKETNIQFDPAVVLCGNNGGQVPVLHNETNRAAVATLLPSASSRAWIALYQDANATQMHEGWYWEGTDGVRIDPMPATVNAPPWGPNQPDDATGTQHFEDGTQNFAQMLGTALIKDTDKFTNGIIALCQFTDDMQAPTPVASKQKQCLNIGSALVCEYRW